MDNYSISVCEREEKTPNQLRREGQVPATVYGPEFGSESVQFSAHEFSRLPAAAFSHLVDLNFNDGKTHSVIIKKVQRRSTTDQVLNVEFYKVILDRKLNVTVPVKLNGTAPAVTLGAQLMEVSLSVDIECLPRDIPDFMEADLGLLKQAEDAIHFSDLVRDEEKIKILNPIDGIVAKAVAPRVVVEDASSAATDSAVSASAKEESAKEEGADGAKKEEGKAS